ncbi:Hypothetical protein SMAX5B_002039 [Scophthalmus maximus]|uniref:Uncharacterized protein n=1 Tax=Scophthalmus maximus TaxID=52904 RepID=A0A2U9CVT5_SCOMX|nr:Hypothetical protein SMAX5B_002039 [Scophthalmus maximus]
MGVSGKIFTYFCGKRCERSWREASTVAKSPSHVLLLIAICHSMYLAIVLRPLRHTEIWVSTRGPLSPWRDQRCDLREVTCTSP